MERARFLAQHTYFRGRPPRDRWIDLVLAFAEVGEQPLDRLFQTALPTAQSAEGGVDSNAVQPGTKLRLPLELANSFEGGQKCVLDRVVGVFVIAKDAAGHD